MQHRITRLASIIVAAAVVLTACGSTDDEATPAATAGSTPPTTEPTTPATTPPTTPATTTPTTPATTPATTPTTTEPPRSELQYDPVALRAELEQARTDWAEFDTPSYRYRYVPVCFCDPATIEAHVIDGKLVNDTGDARLHSIEGWFDIIEDAIGTAHLVRVVYNDWGYPDSVYIDVDETIADEEYGLVFDGYSHVPDAVDKFMTDHYGCGYGFAATSPDQMVSFQVFFESDPSTGTYDLAEAEFAEVQFGTDLMANWCTDIFAEPERVVDERWEIIGGTVTISVAGPATGELRDIVARTADGRDYPLGNATITNTAWGQFAG